MIKMPANCEPNRSSTLMADFQRIPQDLYTKTYSKCSTKHEQSRGSGVLRDAVTRSCSIKKCSRFSTLLKKDFFKATF